MTKTKKAAETGHEALWARPVYQQRSRDQRDRLLKAGERVFADSGFWQAHVAEIANRAGCSVGSFYRRFRDKETFFFALQADMAARAEANIHKFFDDPSLAEEAPEELLTRLVSNSARTIKKIEGYYRALFELSLRGHDVWPPMRRIERVEAERLAQLLRSRGLLAEDHKTDAAMLAVRMVHGQIISAVLHGPGPYEADDPRLHRELGRMLFRYLFVDDAEDGRTTPREGDPS